MLENIRFGKIDNEAIDILKSRFQIIDQNPAIKPTILVTHNYQMDSINEASLKNIPEKSHFFEASYKGNAKKIETLKKNCLAQENLELKIGCQVMMLKNTYQKDGIINGSLGVIQGFTFKKKLPNCKI